VEKQGEKGESINQLKKHVHVPGLLRSSFPKLKNNATQTLGLLTFQKSVFHFLHVFNAASKNCD
jgi:hypothetical protein